MIIEFFGLPGSGKTTITEHLIHKMKSKNFHVIRGTFDHLSTNKRIFNKLIFSFLCLFLNPLFYIKNIFFFFDFSLNRKINITDFVNITYLYSRYFVFANSEKLIFFDQGLTQAYWSTLSFINNGKEYDFELLFKKITNVIIVELDESINKERLFHRNDKRSRLQNNIEYWNVYYNNFNNTKEKLVVNQVFKILNSKSSVNHNVEILEKLITEMQQ